MTIKKRSNRCDKAEGAGGECGEPVDVAEDDRAGADVGQVSLREGADRADQSRAELGFPVGFLHG